jgi:hypothetical protein
MCLWRLPALPHFPAHRSFGGFFGEGVLILGFELRTSHLQSRCHTFYIVSSKLAWATQRDPVSKKKKKTKHFGPGTDDSTPVILATLEADIRRIVV